MKQIFKNILAGIVSCILHLGVVYMCSIIVIGFISIKNETPWSAILLFILLLIVGVAIIGLLAFLGSCALGKITLLGPDKSNKMECIKECDNCEHHIQAGDYERCTRYE